MSIFDPLRTLALPLVSSPTPGASRMRFHLPKPLHGWREFAGEVGIIVIGVLIALGAEQAIDAIHREGLQRDAQRSHGEDQRA